jgi:hypothetical protein
MAHRLPKTLDVRRGQFREIPRAKTQLPAELYRDAREKIRRERKQRTGTGWVVDPTREP